MSENDNNTKTGPNGQAFSYDTTDIDLASWLDLCSWHMVAAVPEPQNPRIRRLYLAAPAGADIEADLSAFDKPVEIVPSELLLSRSNVNKKMRRLCP